MNRLGHVSSGVVIAGRLSGIIWTRFFLVGMGGFGLCYSIQKELVQVYRKFSQKPNHGPRADI